MVLIQHFGILVWIVFINLFLAPSLSSAQDSIAAKPKGKAHFFFQLDQNNSFYKKAGVNTSGFKTGVELRNGIRLGIGFYRLTSDIFEKKLRQEGQIIDTVNAELQMNYTTLSVEYIFFKSKHWQFSAPLQYGGGESDLINTDKEGNVIETVNNKVQLFEFGLSGHYKFFRWGGIGFGGGYRLFFNTKEAVNRNYDSPFYHLGIKLFIDEIFKMIFTPKKLGPWE